MKAVNYDWALNRVISERWAYHEKLFSPEECKEIIKLGKEFGTSDAEVEGGDGKLFVKHEVRRSKNCFLPSNDPKTDFVFRRITDAITKLNDQYFKYDVSKIEVIQFTEYDESYKGFYGKHIDNMYDSTTFRKLSITVQLSDTNDYEGGDLLLHMSDNPNVLKRNIGDLNMFSSFILHEVTPVTKGTRYSLVAWIVGPPFK